MGRPPTGCVEPLRVDDPQTYRLNTWMLGSLDYEATDELSVSLGYYNLSNQIGPDGQRRSPPLEARRPLLLHADRQPRRDLPAHLRRADSHADRFGEALTRRLPHRSNASRLSFRMRIQSNTALMRQNLLFSRLSVTA
jgi:hypothetical protein